jgi:hypothetical protein
MQIFPAYIVSLPDLYNSVRGTGFVLIYTIFRLDFEAGLALCYFLLIHFIIKLLNISMLKLRIHFRLVHLLTHMLLFSSQLAMLAILRYCPFLIAHFSNV